MKIVTFSLGDEIYGLEIEKIQEIIMDPEITGVPNLPFNPRLPGECYILENTHSVRHNAFR